MSKENRESGRVEGEDEEPEPSSHRRDWTAGLAALHIIVSSLYSYLHRRLQSDAED